MTWPTFKHSMEWENSRQCSRTIDRKGPSIGRKQQSYRWS